MKPTCFFVVNMPDMQTGGNYTTPAVLYADIAETVRAGNPEPLIFRRNPNTLAESYERVTLAEVRGMAYASTKRA